MGESRGDVWGNYRVFIKVVGVKVSNEGMSKNVSRAVSRKGLSIRIAGGAKQTDLINQFQSIVTTYRTTNHLLFSSASDEIPCLGHAEGIIFSSISR
jgi:hypothetical protein